MRLCFGHPFINFIIPSKHSFAFFKSNFFFCNILLLSKYNYLIKKIIYNLPLYFPKSDTVKFE